MSTDDRVKVAATHARLRQHARDEAALHLGSVLARQQDQRQALQHCAAALEALEQDQAQRLQSGRPVDLGLLHLSQQAIAHSRTRVNQAEHALTETDRACAIAQAQTARRECERRLAEDWHARQLRERNAGRAATDMRDAQDAQAAARAREPESC